jgi:hypothetical protein
MAAYSVEHLCTVFTSLVALDQACSMEGILPAAATHAPSSLFTSAWLDRFYDYAVPSQCPSELLPGLTTALATAMAQSASAAEESAGEEQDGGSAPPGPPPSSWLRRLEAAACDGAEAMSSREAAVLLSAFGRLRFRPEGATVQRLLDLSLSRAQREAAAATAAASQKQQRGASGAGGAEAAGMAGLLAAANSSLGFVPTSAWVQAVSGNVSHVYPA